jgi:fluoride exporter
VYQALLIFIGGGLGAVARWGVGVAAARLLGTAWPWGTLGVNVAGSFAMGLVMGHLMRNGIGAQSNENLRLFFATGLLGGFTTFSAFSLETVKMIDAGRWPDGAIYAVASVSLSVLAVFAGMALSRANG